jgi:enamine deaminase RidA (YjgF/YER057c/UK114 family)
MGDLAVFTSDLADLSVAQLAVLPVQPLQEFDALLNALQAQVKQARGNLDAALEQRYGAVARSALLASGRDFGVTHLSDGALRISYELPKRVAWNQKQLAAIAERIAAAGERVADYLDVELSVSESRFNHWPPGLQEQFAAARTVKEGKPAFRLALGEDA